MKISLAKNGIDVKPQEGTSSIGVLPYANVTRVQVRSVNWDELAHQVEENALKIADHEGRLDDLELFTERLEERVSANEQTTEDLVHLVNTKMITFSELGE